MFKKTLTAILAATTLFGFNANSFAQNLPLHIGGNIGVYVPATCYDYNQIFIHKICSK